MSHRSHLIVISIAVMTLSFSLPSLKAAQPYMGGYMVGDVQTTDMVVFQCNFNSVNYSQIPDGKFLAAAASVAGSNGVSIKSGHLYQNGFSIENDDVIRWIPQTRAWNISSYPLYYHEEAVGSSNYVFFYGTIAIDVGANEIMYRSYNYKDTDSVEHDNPVKRRYRHPIPSSIDRNFLAGHETLEVVFKYFQVGVECNLTISESNWRILNNEMGFHNGTKWEYLPGKSTWGNYSWWYRINSTHSNRIGGINYDNVDKYSSSNDTVTWEYTNSTIDHNTLLWSGTGTPAMIVYSPFRQVPSWYDDFNDNNRDTFVWDELEANGGTVTETGQKLRLYIPPGQGQAQAGYVTHWLLQLDNRSIEIDVTEFNSVDEMILMISSEKTTSSDPYTQNNWYRIVKTRYSPTQHDWCVQRKVSGDFTNLEQFPSSSDTGKLRIALDDGYIRFYEGSNLRYVEEYALYMDYMQIYIFTSTLRSRNSGTDYMDDFKYQSYDSNYWLDDFNDGQYTGEWTLLSGSASVSGGKLQLSQNGQVTTKDTFGVNRYVKAYVRTISHGENHWEVAFLQGKYEDWDNQVYALMWPDGTVELAVRFDGTQNGWATGSGRVDNPDQEHKWEFVISGDYAVLKIDDEIIFNQYHDRFGDIQGKVGLRANSPSTASFDNIVVID